LEVYEYKYVPGIIDGETLSLAIRNPGRKFRSLVSKSYVERVRGRLIIAHEEAGCELEIDVNDAPPRISPTTLYHVDCGSSTIIPLQAHSSGVFIKLYKPEKGNHVTLVINGIHMHRYKGITPLKDAALKVKYLGAVRGAKVLEIGTGLGYTAISALKRGASLIYTIEANKLVLHLASHNPYSRLLSDGRVRILVGDASKVIRYIRSEAFSKVLHDPPRFQLAGQLYSGEFYSEIFRVLRPGGTLLHYTGEPLRGRGRGHGPIVKGVMDRLRRAGFHRVRYIEEVGAVIAWKP